MRKKVLFLCTGNSARSQMAEAVLNHRGSDNFIAYSAGSNPANEIHPLAFKVLSHTGFDMTGKRPKSMEEYINEISQRITLFLNLPMEKLDRMALELKVKEIGTVSL